MESTGKSRDLSYVNLGFESDWSRAQYVTRTDWSKPVQRSSFITGNVKPIKAQLLSKNCFLFQKVKCCYVTKPYLNFGVFNGN